MFDIHNGDCAEVMASMESDSVDAIVTDPPYGLAFMGAKWDSFNGSSGNQTISERQAEGKRYADENKGAPRYANSHGKKVTQSEMAAFQLAMTPIFEEALRVAKPGAHLLCFGGTRTFHRMACAIEDAGWEIRDCIMWVYGCLDEETEVLVDGEFVPYNKATKGRLALGYDIESGAFSWQRIEDTYLYDYDDTAYAIQSDSTDQLVSRNHRCIVERGGVEQFAFAEQVAQEREACVPVLEGLHGLLDHLPLPDQGTSGEEQDVLEGVRGEGREPSAEGAQGPRTEHDMSRLRESVLRAASMAAEGQDELLLGELSEQGGVCTKTCETQQGTSTLHVGEAQAGTQGADDGSNEPCMERRGDVPQASWQLRERAVCEVPSGVCVNGTQGRLRDGAQTCGCSGDRTTADKAGVRTSHQSRPAGQQARELDAVPIKHGAQAIRGTWGAKATLARVTPVHYKGKMWCIKVATGAFVARRHGKIFVTGNSGFPKSMDVSKAIDKALGAERKKRNGDGEHIGNVDFGMKNRCPKCGKPYFSADPCKCPREDKVPVTDQAKEWDGWGTCLKPAWEPIIVARKPLDGTVAHNVLTWGVGALNIDACRVAIEQSDDVFAKNPHTHSKGKDSGIYGAYKEQQGNWNGEKGRFPANVVHDGSQMVLDLFPDTGKSSGGGGVKAPGKNGIYGSYSGHEYPQQLGMGDTGSAARFFYCAKASKKDRGEGNNHPTVKPTELMKWLVQLVTPEGG